MNSLTRTVIALKIAEIHGTFLCYFGEQKLAAIPWFKHIPPCGSDTSTLLFSSEDTYFIDEWCIWSVKRKGFHGEYRSNVKRYSRNSCLNRKNNYLSVPPVEQDGKCEHCCFSFFVAGSADNRNKPPPQSVEI